MGRKRKKKSEQKIRTTISLDPGLKAHMDEATDVNWSRIASKAFEQQLAVIASRKEDPSIDEAVLRLRESRRLVVDSSHDDGWEAGAQWAKKKATWQELTKLEESYSGKQDEYWDLLEKEAGSSTIDETVGTRFLIRLDTRLDIRARHRWWAENSGATGRTKSDDKSFVRGFCEGALSVWNLIKSKV